LNALEAAWVSPNPGSDTPRDPEEGSVIAIDVQQGLTDAWDSVATFVPKLVGFLVGAERIGHRRDCPRAIS
jgi:hypothetical protein